MSMSYTTNESETFSIIHARRIASRVATDLLRFQSFYGFPSDKSIDDYEEELAVLLKEGIGGLQVDDAEEILPGAVPAEKAENKVAVVQRFPGFLIEVFQYFKRGALKIVFLLLLFSPFFFSLLFFTGAGVIRRCHIAKLFAGAPCSDKFFKSNDFQTDEISFEMIRYPVSFPEKRGNFQESPGKRVASP